MIYRFLLLSVNILKTFPIRYYFDHCRCIDMDAYLKSPISTSLVVIAAVFEGLATFFVALRFLLRIKFKQGVMWDDWLALLSLVSRIA